MAGLLASQYGLKLPSTVGGNVARGRKVVFNNELLIKALW